MICRDVCVKQFFEDAHDAEYADKSMCMVVSIQPSVKSAAENTRHGHQVLACYPYGMRGPSLYGTVHGKGLPVHGKHVTGTSHGHRACWSRAAGLVVKGTGNVSRRQGALTSYSIGGRRSLAIAMWAMIMYAMIM